MQLATVDTMDGPVTINVEQITYITATNLGAQIHFTSGEALICTKHLGELTLELAPYGTNMRGG